MMQLFAFQKGLSNEEYTLTLYSMVLYTVYLSLDTICFQTGNNREFPIDMFNLALQKCSRDQWILHFHEYFHNSICWSVVVATCNRKFTICMYLCFPTVRMEYIDLIYAFWSDPVFAFSSQIQVGPRGWTGEDFAPIMMFSYSWLIFVFYFWQTSLKRNPRNKLRRYIKVWNKQVDTRNTDMAKKSKKKYGKTVFTSCQILLLISINGNVKVPNSRSKVSVFALRKNYSMTFMAPVRKTNVWSLKFIF